MMKIVVLSLSMLLSVSGGLYAAEEQADPVKENAELKARVERLEAELAQLKQLIISQAKGPAAPAETKAASPAAPYVGTPPAERPLTESELDKIAAIVEKRSKKEEGPLAGFEFIPYGYVKLDASYDTSKMFDGNFAAWVLPGRGNVDDDEFDMTARSTRLGVKINSREKSDIVSSGIVEIDFYGDTNGGADNKPGVLLRHAFAKLDWPEERFSILFGQTWDVIAPLNPNTLNYTVQWWAGNIGYRRPQIRATKIFGLSDKVDLKLEGAVTRNIAALPGDVDAGEDSGLPAFQGRVSATFPLLNEQPTTVGLSGHWGDVENDGPGPRHYDSWSLNMDLTQPVNKWLSVQGEMYTGQDLAPYLGGIGQGINNTLHRTIGDRGGWVAAHLGPWSKWSFNVGVSIDDPDNEDLVGLVDGDGKAVAKRTYNRAVFGNVIYSINKSTEVGFELSQWRTGYLGQRDADSIRAQTSLIYKF